MARSGVQLSQVVPWGRSLAEYVGMFALSERDLGKRILDCAAGPASFNAEMTARGYRVVSCDPLYAFSSLEIRQRFDATFATMMGQMPSKRDNFVWDTIPSIPALGEMRRAAMDAFLRDFVGDRRGSRYVVSALPQLPFADGSFDLTLCSHFLFLYSEHLGEAFHLTALRELCRVATEVRVFPLLDLDGQVPPHLGPALTALRRAGFHATVRGVPYEFLKGANEMLVIEGQSSGDQALSSLQTAYTAESMNKETTSTFLSER